MTPLRDMPTNKPTTTSEIETALNHLQYGVEELQSKIAALSDRIASILRVNAPPAAGSETKRELPHTIMAVRLEDISAAVSGATKEIEDIVNRCEL